MLSLRAEIAACLFAVSLLGLITGWMMQRARAARRLRRAVASLEERHADAERSARQDVANLEERLQSLGEEHRALAAENRELRESARDDEASADAVRAESIEQNRRQVEIHERLQRIVREREREIATLRAGLAGHEREDVPVADGASVVAADAIVPEGLDETVRIDPSLLPVQLASRTGDARVADVHAIRPPPTETVVEASADASDEMSEDTTIALVDETADDAAASLDDTLESTVDVAFLDGEEATVALDEETLSLVRGLGRGERKG